MFLCARCFSPFKALFWSRHFTSSPDLHSNYSWVINKLLDTYSSSGVEISKNVSPDRRKIKFAEAIQDEVRGSTSVAEILSTLHSFEGSRIEKLPLVWPNVYRECLQKIRVLVEPSSSAHSILQALYVSSLGKKAPSSQALSKLLTKFLQDKYVDFSPEEMAILCNCMFRSSLQLSEGISNHLMKLIKSDPNLITDSNLLLCYIKSLRNSLKYDEDFFKLLASNIDTIKKFHFIIKVHILVYFSDAWYAEEEVNKIFQLCLEDAKQLMKNKDQIRIKDIDNMFWAISNYNITIDDGLDFILTYIRSQFSINNIDTKRRLFGILLSIWTLGIRDKALFKFVNKESISFVKQDQDIKVSGKIGLLLTCMHIEAPELLSDGLLELRNLRLEPKMSKYLKSRPELGRVLRLVRVHQMDLGLDDVLFWYPVTCLYIAGLKATVQGINFSIEVLDSTVRLRNSSTLHGRMNLKLRLMEKIKIKYCVLDSSRNDDELLMNLRNWMQDNFNVTRTEFKSVPTPSQHNGALLK